jgi:hypothetical protein
LPLSITIFIFITPSITPSIIIHHSTSAFVSALSPFLPIVHPFFMPGFPLRAILFLCSTECFPVNVAV